MAWKYYNPNPVGHHTEDCSIRALTVALDTSWDQTYDILTEMGFNMGLMPHSNSVIAGVLRKYGFKRQVIPNRCPDCYTLWDFCIDHPMGIYVLFCDSHVATVKNGILYDSWDSSREIPQFYWYKEE